jgi:acetoin utilization deacetylase AcuC-like enzyme
MNYDLVYFYPEGHQAHFVKGHPERPERVETIRQALVQSNLWNGPNILIKEPLQISQAILQEVHDKEYLSYLQAASKSGVFLDSETYTTHSTWQLALNAAGGAAAVASEVWQGNARKGFALTRPPGHHASRNRGEGFCLINNIALASEYLIRTERAQKLAIIDLDLHHGNGTQDIFWSRGDVFYISTHQFPLYPGTGRLDDRGAGPGAGKTANIPLPPMSGDKAFQVTMEAVILPLLTQYAPEMLLVSIGFDAHWRDPLGNLQLSVDGYGRLVENLSAWADAYTQGRIALFLEGGYDLQAGAASAVAAVSAMLGKKWDDPFGPAPSPEGTAWKDVISQVVQIWGLRPA